MLQNNLDLQVKEFYSKIKFPGNYTFDDIDFYQSKIANPYLKIIDDHLDDDLKILDIGCGTGYILNLFAHRYKSSFDGIDFSDAIDVAKSFSKQNNVKNIKYFKSDFLQIDQTEKYDIVLCQGVLHHIPDYKKAVDLIKKITKKKLILAVYHPSGKILKKYFKIDYRSDLLRADQEDVPFETTFNKHEVLSMFTGFKLVESYPSNPNLHFVLNPMRHSRNGGLVTYVLEKDAD
jgi:SAM-dependent methyltransferase